MKSNTKYLTLSGLLIALAIAVQVTGRAIPAISQGFVGPLINSILIISLLFTNTKYASMVAIITPITAFLTGQLNPAMGFFVPFICLGNVLYVILFSVIKINMNKWIESIVKLTVASIGKFILLSFSATKIIAMLSLGVNEKIMNKLAIAMGLPQLYTAMIGGLFAIVFYSIVSTKIKSSESSNLEI